MNKYYCLQNSSKSMLLYSKRYFIITTIKSLYKNEAYKNFLEQQENKKLINLFLSDKVYTPQNKNTNVRLASITALYEYLSTLPNSEKHYFMYFSDGLFDEFENEALDFATKISALKHIYMVPIIVGQDCNISILNALSYTGCAYKLSQMDEFLKAFIGVDLFGQKSIVRKVTYQKPSFDSLYSANSNIKNKVMAVRQELALKKQSEDTLQAIDLNEDILNQSSQDDTAQLSETPNQQEKDNNELEDKSTPYLCLQLKQEYKPGIYFDYFDLAENDQLLDNLIKKLELSEEKFFSAVKLDQYRKSLPSLDSLYFYLSELYLEAEKQQLYDHNQIVKSIFSLFDQPINFEEIPLFLETEAQRDNLLEKFIYIFSLRAEIASLEKGIKVTPSSSFMDYFIKLENNNFQVSKSKAATWCSLGAVSPDLFDLISPEHNQYNFINYNDDNICLQSIVYCEDSKDKSNLIATLLNFAIILANKIFDHKKLSINADTFFNEISDCFKAIIEFEEIVCNRKNLSLLKSYPLVLDSTKLSFSFFIANEDFLFIGRFNNDDLSMIHAGDCYLFNFNDSTDSFTTERRLLNQIGDFDFKICKQQNVNCLIANNIVFHNIESFKFSLEEISSILANYASQNLEALNDNIYALLNASELDNPYNNISKYFVIFYNPQVTNNSQISTEVIYEEYTNNLHEFLNYTNNNNEQRVNLDQLLNELNNTIDIIRSNYLPQNQEYEEQDPNNNQDKDPSDLSAQENRLNLDTISNANTLTNNTNNISQNVQVPASNQVNGSGTNATSNIDASVNSANNVNQDSTPSVVQISDRETKLIIDYIRNENPTFFNPESINIIEGLSCQNALNELVFAVAASKRGKYHINKQLINQDAFLIKDLSNNSYKKQLIVCCDGVGSSVLSFYGAHLACQAVQDVCQRVDVFFENKQANNLTRNFQDVQKIKILIFERWKRLVYSFMEQHRQLLADYGPYLNYDDYATTCLIAFRSNNSVLLMQLGDGKIFLETKDNVQRPYLVFNIPQENKYVTECLCSSINLNSFYHKIIKFDDNFKKIMMVTDGFESLLTLPLKIQKSNNAEQQQSLFDYVRLNLTTEEKGKKNLNTILTNIDTEYFNKDDKTFVALIKQ